MQRMIDIRHEYGGWYHLETNTSSIACVSFTSYEIGIAGLVTTLEVLKKLILEFGHGHLLNVSVDENGTQMGGKGFPVRK